MEVIKNLLEKISNFFDLFDISYFVSGIATLGIIYFLPGKKDVSYNLPDGINTLWWFVICYALGMISSSLGRKINQKKVFFNKKDHLRKYLHFEKVLIDSKLDISLSKQLIEATQNGANLHKYEEGSLKSAYRLMWATLRERKDVPESLILMRRYWLNSSTLDGLTVSSIVAFLVSCYNLAYNWIGINGMLSSLPLYFAIISSIAFFTFSAEANRFRRYQVEELVGTYIHTRNKDKS